MEDQSRISTRKLVDSDAEQERLEHLIETAKPPLPKSPAFANLHYLLATPFRYAPLRWGSRFRRQADPGAWYGARTVETALAEKAYHRLRLLEDTAAEFQTQMTFTAFEVPLRSSLAIDLAGPPFAAFEKQISDPASYAHSQPLGRSMRGDGVILARYVSARDPRRGHNVAVFSPEAFVSKIVSDAARETWHCYATRRRVEFHLQSFVLPRTVAFDRAVFEIHGRLPMPTS